MADAIDMTGWKMWEHGIPDSKLIVIERGPNHSDRHAQWWCKCSCDENKQPFLVKSANIRQGRTKSCGCIQQQQRRINGLNGKGIEHQNYIDMTGWIMKQHGVPDSLITVLYKTNKRSAGGSILWHCIDENGFQADIPSNNLRIGRTLSCGSIKNSKGQYKIAKILTENNINFERQYYFDDLRDKLPLRFDFYVQNSYFIEFDGIQHSQESINSNWSTLEYNQKHDKMKNDYCKKKGIPLIRIPYTRFKELNINDLLLETSNFKVY